MNTINRQPNQIDEINYYLRLNREERELLFSHYVMIYMMINNFTVITEDDLKLLRLNADFLLDTIKRIIKKQNYLKICVHILNG